MPTEKPPTDGRIPDAVVTSVKNNSSFLSLLRGYGIETRRKGKSLFAVCPFHELDGKPEKDPSLSIDTARNLYHCFSCNARGNIIQFVMEMDKLTFPEAVNKLLAIKGERLERAKRGGGVGKAAKEENAEPPPPLLTEPERQAVLWEVVRRCTEQLRAQPVVREYLESRGLDALGLLDCYTIGYWHSPAVMGRLAEGEREKLAAVGLVNDGRALFEGCLVFPLVKEDRISGMYGRKASADPAAGRHYLLPGRREGLFLPHGDLNPRKPVIITESIIDAISLFVAGVTNVLPLLGVNGFLPDHLRYLKARSFPRILIALNGDEAGRTAAPRLRENLTTEGLSATVVELPAGKDGNDLLRELGPRKLREWFAEKSGEPEGEAPSVWEDDAGTCYVTYGKREYRLQGLTLHGMDKLRANIRLCHIGSRDTFHLDTLDLYQARAREHFISQGAKTLSASPELIAQDINRLIVVLEEHRLRKKEQADRPKAYEMSPEERREALEYLRAPNLLERIAADFAACGMVGNRTQNLLAYLGALSRLTERPFGTLIVSRSGAGKSFLQEMVAHFTPEESLLRMTRLTGQSLFYQGKDGLKHKLLTIEEDEGMQEAMYSIRTLLSSQKLTVHSLKTDQKSGEFRAYENTVEGPASVMISTTNLSAFDHESVNRFFVLFLDESAEQTRAILAHQRRMAGEDKLRLKVRRERLHRLHRNVQRLLKPVAVVNRIGTGVEYPERILNTRREQTKTETLIEAVALLHQYQRPVETASVYGMHMQYIEVSPEDLAAVHELAGEVLRQSLDEMPKLCRDLLEHIHAIVNEKHNAALAAREGECPERWRITFTRKELRERSGWSMWHIKEHVRELEEAGYITPRTGRKGQRYCYSLVEDEVPAIPDVKRSLEARS